MKKSRMFIGVAMVVFALLSCNDTGTNTDDGDDNNPIAKAGTKQPPDVPVIITDDVKQWMNEQLASKSNEKRRIMISEMYPPEFISGTGLELSATSDSKGNVKYFLDDKEISAEEYNHTVESAKQKTNTKRNLSFPGVIYESNLTWTVLISAEELDGLSKKYSHLAISFEPNDQEG